MVGDAQESLRKVKRHQIENIVSVDGKAKRAMMWYNFLVSGARLQPDSIHSVLLLPRITYGDFFYGFFRGVEGRSLPFFPCRDSRIPVKLKVDDTERLGIDFTLYA